MKYESQKPTVLPTALAMQENGTATKTFVLRRGELGNPGDEVHPGWPAILMPGLHRTAPIKTPSPRSTGRHSALAAWIASPANPLTARVLVNRVWQHHFGRGLVATPSDFGVPRRSADVSRTPRLARVEFVERLSHQALASADFDVRTYQQATICPPEAQARSRIDFWAA